MHVFMDEKVMCKEAYATCVFFRSKTPQAVKIQLIRVKDRVASIKQASIPILESIGSRLRDLEQ